LSGIIGSFFQKKQKTKNQSKEKRKGFHLIFLYKTYYAESKEIEFFNAFAP